MDIGIPKEARPASTGSPHAVGRPDAGPAGPSGLGREGRRPRGRASDADYQAAGAQIAYSRHEVFGRAAAGGPRSSRPIAAGVPRAVPGPGGLRVLGAAGGAPGGLPRAADREVTAIGIEAIEDDDGARAGAHVDVRDRRRAGGDGGQRAAAERVRRQGHPARRRAGRAAGHFVILGAGVLGRAAARAALGLGAQVTLLDRSVAHLRERSRSTCPRECTTMLATQPNIEKALSLRRPGAGRRGGARPARAGARDARDAAADEAAHRGRWTCRSTWAAASRPRGRPLPRARSTRSTASCTSASRTCRRAAARSATLALTNAVLPYVVEVADAASRRPCGCHPELARGTYLHRGRCTSEPLARIVRRATAPLLPGVEGEADALDESLPAAR